MVRAVRLCVVLSLLVIPTAAAAQSNDPARGEATIVVSDTTGARVADASVVMTRGAERRTATTGADGVARISNLAPGEWTVTITRDGFARLARQLAVSAGSVEMPAALAVAGFSETVQVETDAIAPTQVPLNAIATGGTN